MIRPLFPALPAVFSVLFSLLLSLTSSEGVAESVSSPPSERAVVMTVFMSETCPHCRAQKPFLAQLERARAGLEVKSYEVMTTDEHHTLLENMASLHGVRPGSVPMIFVGGKVWTGDSRQIRKEIVAHVDACLSESGCGG